MDSPAIIVFLDIDGHYSRFPKSAARENVKYEKSAIVSSRHFPDGIGTGRREWTFLCIIWRKLNPGLDGRAIDIGEVVRVKPHTVNCVSRRGHHRRTATMLSNQLSNQSIDPSTTESAQMFSDDPDKMLLKYFLSQTAKVQNNRKLQEHLEKIRKFGGRPPRVVQYVQNWHRRASDHGEL